MVLSLNVIFVCHLNTKRFINKFLRKLQVEKKAEAKQKKNGEKSLGFGSELYFSRTNNFIRLKLTPTKNFYQLFFLLSKSYKKS